MRLKQLENQWRVWLNPRDYLVLREHARDFTVELAIRFGAEVGLRVSETAQVKYSHIRESTHPEVDARFMSVYGKETTGTHGDGKHRDAFIPERLYHAVLAHSLANDIAPDEHQFYVRKRTIQGWIKDAAEAAADATGNPDYEKVSSHDLRAYFATDCLIRRGMNPRVVMEVGGWADYRAMKPYLNAMFDDVIADEFRDAGVR